MKHSILNTTLIAGLAVAGSVASAAPVNAESVYARDLASWTGAPLSLPGAAQKNAFYERDLASWTGARLSVTPGVAVARGSLREFLGVITENPFYARDLASWTGNSHLGDIASGVQNAVYARDLASWYSNGLRQG